ncbi:glycosyltransferase [Microcoleus sp. FACHB-68]|uniref:glycosyltransferase n=1 Tax=Microcoleus sp. FACHB-68 TaxID=2692826 RepID=UPI0016858E0A|nr:glycosyltransferase [Microcoleus sp. FACHB-68]MBD1936413.1 glycosyltransferase [Microcoleus sp. FACHB-68]
MTKKLKVSILSPTLSKGGVDRAYLLGQVLRELNYEVAILGFLFGECIYPLPPAELPVDSVPGGIYPQLFTSAKQLLNKIDGDIIYAVKPKPTSFGIALLKKLSTRRPVILDIDDWELSWCGGDEWRYRPSLKQLARDILKRDGALRDASHPVYLQWMEKLVKGADAVTVDTHFLQQRFGGIYLPNGKDTSLFDPAKFNSEASRVRYGLAEYRVLMFPGAPRPHKGLEDILMALDRLNQSDLRLVIVGGNPYDDYDDKLIARWGRWIVKLPPAPVDRMPEIVAAAHVVVVPQRDTVTARAQFPIKLTEGMAMAKPVLATRVGDIPEILSETGYLAAPSCPEELADQIQLIFQDYKTANIQGMKARNRCLECYSVPAMASILSKVLASL